MYIRPIHIINNFYASAERSKSAKDDYSSLGYFDAVVPMGIYSSDLDKPYSIWKMSSDDIMRHLDGTCTRRMIPCYIPSHTFHGLKRDIVEKQFWKRAHNYPVTVFSLIRLQKAEKLPDETLISKMDKKTTNTFWYYTSIHSEIVLVSYGENVSVCREHIQSFKVLFPDSILKTYSIISLNEKEEAWSNLKDENITCRLFISVRDEAKFDSYKKSIIQDLGISELPVFRTAGPEDYIAEIDSVSLKDLAKAYCSGGVLTHSQYKDAIYNIETLLLNKKE